MTVSVDAKTGTFDGIAPNPCGALAPTPVTCAGICDGLELAKYAAGDLCPLNQQVTLYEDDFTGYLDGSAIGNPPWTTFNDLAAQNQTTFATTVTGQKCVAGRFTGNGSTPTSYQTHKWNQGYTLFDSNPCGVFTQCIYRGRVTSGGSGNITGGLCIGADAATTAQLIWVFGSGGSGGTASGIRRVTNWPSSFNTFDSGAAYQPAVGDTCRLQLIRNGAFGWRLEAYINGVLIGSTTDSLIQLSHASPKAVGFFFGGNGQAFHGATPSDFYLSDWEGGVT